MIKISKKARALLTEQFTNHDGIVAVSVTDTFKGTKMHWHELKSHGLVKQERSYLGRPFCFRLTDTGYNFLASTLFKVAYK